MKIEILGGGCAKCNLLKKNVNTAFEKIGISGEIKIVDDMNQIMKYKVMSTPALVIDGKVKASGSVPSVKEIIRIFNQETSEG